MYTYLQSNLLLFVAQLLVHISATTALWSRLRIIGTSVTSSGRLLCVSLSDEDEDWLHTRLHLAINSVRFFDSKRHLSVCDM